MIQEGLKNKSFYQKNLTHFEVLKVLAEIWEKPLKREENSIICFLSFMMENIYGIPKNLIDGILVINFC